MSFIKTISVPVDLLHENYSTYLAHQTGLWFEDYFRRYLRDRIATVPVQDGEPWTYLPLGWTALEARYRELPRFVRKYFGAHSLLYRRLGRVTARVCAENRRVFAVCQHARGVEVDRRVKRPENLLVFSCGGNGHVPLPLLCDKRDVAPMGRDLLASFQGVVRHPRHEYPWREAMAREFEGKPGTRIVDTESPEGAREDYLGLLARSRFGLCPRGYGRTSFRLMEVMHAGCVPVYIHAGDAWLPYQDLVDWTEFCVLVDYRNIDGLHAQLAALPEAKVVAMARRAKAVCDRFFTMEFASGYVLDKLREWNDLSLDEIFRRTEALRTQ